MINYDKDREFWEDLYISGDTTWDLGGPTPIFERLSKNINPGKLCSSVFPKKSVLAGDTWNCKFGVSR